jgi:hypothetical protein
MRKQPVPGDFVEEGRHPNMRLQIIDERLSFYELERGNLRDILQGLAQAIRLVEIGIL